MVEVLPFQPRDHEQVMALWQATEGITLREADSREAILAYLARTRASASWPAMEMLLWERWWLGPTADAATCSTWRSHRRTGLEAWAGRVMAALSLGHVACRSPNGEPLKTKAKSLTARLTW